MTSEEMLTLATRLREAAHYCTELITLEDQCRYVADELERHAAQPQIPTYFKYGRDISDRGDQTPQEPIGYGYSAEIQSGLASYFIVVREKQDKYDTPVYADTRPLHDSESK